MDVVQTLDASRRNAYDPDEIEEEQRERERRNRINAEYQQFVRRVQELWERDFSELQLEFDIPFKVSSSKQKTARQQKQETAKDSKQAREDGIWCFLLNCCYMGI